MNANAENNIPFLAGGGEMGKLTREKDWSKTPVGNPDSWPASLRTTLGIVLSSKFPMFIWWGPELTCFYNDAYRPSLGQNGKHPSILGLPAKEAWPEIWDVIKPLIDQVLAGGEATWSEDQLIPIYRNGNMEDVYWTFSYSPIIDETGKRAGVLVICTETTEKIKWMMSQNKLKENEERLHIVIDSSELGTWEWHLGTDKIFYSPRYLEIFGYTGGNKMLHTDMLKHIHPDDLEYRANVVREAIESGQLNYELRIIWTDKSIHWIEAKGKFFYDENKQPVKLIGTLRDITEDKDHQQKLQEREQKFRLLADSMPQHIWTADTEGNLNYFNQSVFDYSGLTPEQINEGGWLQIVHPDDRPENINKWLAAVTSGNDFLFEHRFRRYDGEYRWQLSRAIAQRDAAGNIQMWVGTSTDIQDQKMFTHELERQVQERTKELEQKNRDLEKMNAELQSFAYVSSHDLQEPLRKIQTFATHILQKENENLSATGKDYFHRMQKAANRMQTLIEDLLMYSRTNNTERIFKHTDLEEIIHEVKHDFKEILFEKNAKIKVIETCKANVIPFQFRQLIHNLISNSVKFSKQDEILLITVNCKIVKGNTLNVESLLPQKSYCHITISDNGIGFDPQYKTRIFEIFQRLHGREQYSGTGIGLAIVKKIVDNHSGVITASGELNKGARFDIYFPA